MILTTVGNINIVKAQQLNLNYNSLIRKLKVKRITNLQRKILKQNEMLVKQITYISMIGNNTVTQLTLINDDLKT